LFLINEHDDDDYGRPYCYWIMDAMMQEDEESEINCAKLKEKAHDRKLASLRKNNLPSGRKHWGGAFAPIAPKKSAPMSTAICTQSPIHPKTHFNKITKPLRLIYNLPVIDR